MLILDDKDKFTIESATTDDIKNKRRKHKRKGEIKQHIYRTKEKNIRHSIEQGGKKRKVF